MEQQQAAARLTAHDEGVEALYGRYADMVYRLAFLRTRSGTDADDVLQEVFLRALRANPVWRDREHQKAWFIRVTINCTKSLLTSAFRRHTAPLDDNLLTEMEERTEVYGKVLQLPVKYRTIVHLYYYEGYHVEEIARMLSANPSTVKSWLFRARDMLREELKGEFLDV